MERVMKAMRTNFLIHKLVILKPISMNKINLTPFNHCYFPPTVIPRLYDNPVTCFGPFLQKCVLI